MAEIGNAGIATLASTAAGDLCGGACAGAVFGVVNKGLNCIEGLDSACSFEDYAIAAGEGVLLGQAGDEILGVLEDVAPEVAANIKRLFGNGDHGPGGDGVDSGDVTSGDGTGTAGAEAGSTAPADVSDAAAIKQTVANDHAPAAPPTGKAEPIAKTVAKPSANDIPEGDTVTATKPSAADSVTAPVVKPDVSKATPVKATPGEATAPEAAPEAGVATDAPSCSVVPHSFIGSTNVLMADGTTKPIDQVKTGEKIGNSVPGQKGNAANTVTAVVVTHTDHDFVGLTIKPEAGSTAATTTTKVAPTSSSSTPTKLSIAKKAAASLTAALMILASTPASASAAAPAVADAGSTVGGSLTTTYHHPFYDITQQSFVDAQYLHIGDQLQTTTGSAVVTGVRLFYGVTTTYDLTIGELHTYYVLAGSTPVLVHNNNTGDTCEIVPSAGGGSEPQQLPQYGPFHRLDSPTATVADTQLSIDSGELWGGMGRQSDSPMVQAHNGPLPDGAQGFEFYTDVAPNPYNVGHRANWSITRPGVEPRVGPNGEDMAGIPIVITRVNHGDIQWPLE